MKVGIISDTHDSAIAANKAMELFSKLGVEVVVHAGDWITPETVNYFEKLAGEKKIPIKGVLGNNDQKIGEMLKSKTLNIKWVQIERGDVLQTEIDNRKIAMVHGHVKGSVQSVVNSGKFDLVIRGHTHRVKKEKRDKTLIVNPGSASFDIFRRKSFEPTVAVYNTRNNEAKIVFLR